MVQGIHQSSLKSYHQGPNETAKAFLKNALDLRQHIMFACSDEDSDTSLQYDPMHNVFSFDR